jgi:hypothetical protein
VAQFTAEPGDVIGRFLSGHIRDSMMSASDGIYRLLRRMTILEVDPDSLPSMQRPMCGSEVFGSSAFSVHMRTGEVLLSNVRMPLLSQDQCRAGSAVP